MVFLLAFFSYIIYRYKSTIQIISYDIPVLRFIDSDIFSFCSNNLGVKFVKTSQNINTKLFEKLETCCANVKYFYDKVLICSKSLNIFCFHLKVYSNLVYKMCHDHDILQNVLQYFRLLSNI